MKRLFLSTFICALFILSQSSAATAAAADTFRLLTTEAAANPAAGGVVGLQEAGIRSGSFLVDTNPLYDLLLIENLGVKYVTQNESWGFTAGLRYLYFVGSSVLEGQLKNRESRIQSFHLNANGPLAFVGASYRLQSVGFHFNFQYADVSGSKVASPIFASDIALSENWSAVAEAGYDLANKQPRASLGFTRNGPSFGTRLGVTYVKIDDAALKYEGVAPIIDVFWLFGGGAQ